MWSVSFAQVQHNFTMGPSKTTCDSLDIKALPQDEWQDALRNATFRYAEELKISKYKSPRHLWFYSCDGETGHLIAKETDEMEIVLINIKKADWDTFMEAKDPITAYQTLKKTYSND